MYVEVKLAADVPKSFSDIEDAQSPCALDGADPFEKLHDCVVLQIFNRIGDIKALGRCSVVSKRFSALTPLIENVTVKVDCVITGEDSGLGATEGGFLSHFFRFVVGSLVKPLQVFQHMLGSKKAVPTTNVSPRSPGEVLKNFQTIRNLQIELPGGELGVEDGVVLKWRAEFGSTLESCMILGASGIVKPEGEGDYRAGKFEFGRSWFLQGRQEGRLSVIGGNTSLPMQDDSESLPESFYTNGGLKLRVVWTISSLIAASARHYLLQQIICDHPTLTRLVLTDADGQGVLCMGREQLQEFRNKPIAASASANRTQVPALNMKLWYAPYIELPGGMGLKGATLVAIRPIEQPMCKEVDGFVDGAFEEPFQSAVCLLAKRRTYLLEMNSF